MLSRRACPALLLSLSALALIAAAPAHADLNWSGQPQQLSSGDQNSATPVVGVDAQGGAVAAWARPDTAGDRINVAIRPAGGSFGPPQIISAAFDSSDPQVAVAPDGRALLVWTQDGTPGYDNKVIMASFRPAGGGFGTPQQLTDEATATLPAATSPRVAMDAQGNAVIAWIYTETDGTQLLQARYRSAAGALGPPQTNIFAAGGGLPGGDPGVIYAPHLAMDTQGNAVLAWTDNPFPYPADRFESEVRAARRLAGAASTFDAQALLASRSSPDYPQSVTGVDASISNGNAMVSWYRNNAGRARTDYVYRAAGSSSWGAAQTLAGDTSNPQNSAYGALTVWDGLGNGVTTWSHANGAEVIQAFRPAGGSLGAGTRASPAGVPTSSGRMGIDGSGNVVALWSSQSQWASTYRPAGAASAFEPPTPRFGYDTFPALAVAANGQSAAVWTQTVNDNTGPNVQIMAAFGSPAGAPPPPPPPPPRPPRRRSARSSPSAPSRRARRRSSRSPSPGRSTPSPGTCRDPRRGSSEPWSTASSRTASASARPGGRTGCQ